MTTPLELGGYEIRLDRRYHPDTHLWVQEVGDGRVRVGFDALTADTYGALAQLVMSPAGSAVGRGDEFGSLEAAKFVGPLTAPVSGVIAAVNAEVLADPETVLRDPYGHGWLAEFTVADGVGDLLEGEAAREWFADEVAAYRDKGLVAE
ncbi:glycine cleavage system protein H [Gordonia rhizosphera]|uniref:Glycine cleavage system H protein n=1 Tax=Gordonia rhizosphera NBRC 16068 TaxID=1108045 RepID=K6WF63_9ACTN|nr:glycine cleavage system protein H [Gordonia rhizosphera]GAB90787.1 glycine cleavage system H protein [Gordonia rhizosphera NBRC 16068]